MYKLNDLTKFKNEELISIAESKNVQLSKKAVVIDLLTSAGYVSKDEASDTILVYRQR